MIFAGLYFLGTAAFRLHTQLTGVEGTLVEAECVVSEDSEKGKPLYECAGSFHPADRSFYIPYLEVADTTFPAVPKEPVTVYVDGPGADTAVMPGKDAWLAYAVGGGVLLPLGIFMAVRGGRRRTPAVA
ncbi:hypothetical protein GCM10010329_36860 [Streptomyces spiroverticillatus]|uniref:Uncharacterized protein n=1 Tax=Streptomyces finlayi TaxID=67296 RepID=A0A918WYC7_9ACTN|nr:hypothetical protein [Streptomyces finlayi]GHA10699.1 hypothetical protein GCM10010329_36860 [Streptomyces spiroverticillatus]GHC95459.1 hypothetical protein GCM10010334_34750 [Streptomyces finlayi]